MSRIRVIACGNPDAGDDAVGLLVGEELRRRGFDVVMVRAAVQVLYLLDAVDVAIVVDAIRTPSGERPPGTLVRAEAGPDGRLPAELRSSLSSHGLGVAEAVGLAAALGSSPRVIVHGIEIAEVTAGAPLSAEVAAGLPELVRRIEDEVRSRP